MSDLLTPDLCVIGAGSGGLTLAAGAVQMGASVVLIEAGEMGGDCLNTGCVPSKALLAAASAAAGMRGAARFGIGPNAPVVGIGAVRGHVAQAIATIAHHDSEERFAALGCRVVRARAAFTGPDEVAAGTWRIRARRFVLATGSHAAVPDLPGLAAVPFLTNETIFSLLPLPDHLLILGAGPIGLEMAQAHRRLGAAVTVLEADQPLPREDRDAADLVIAALRAEGVTILTGQRVTRVSDEGGISLHLAGGQTVSGSHLLVATGRRPAVAGLGLELAGIAHDQRGVRVDARLRSTNRRVFAIGDVAGLGQFTHLAAYQAGIVLRQAVLGLPARIRQDHIPRVTFTDPELAQIGPIEAEARQHHGPRLTVLRADFAANDRAIASGRESGFVKLLVVRGRVIGATVVGPDAGEVLAPLALAVSARMRVLALASMVLPYPTLAEVVKRAASAYFSPKLFDNAALRRWVRLVQRLVP